MMQQQSNPTEGAFRHGSLELVIALGSLALVIGIGIGVIFNQSMRIASLSAVEPTVQPTRQPKPARVKPAGQPAAVARVKPTAQPAAARIKPTAQPAAAARRVKPTAQPAKATSVPKPAAQAATSAAPAATPAPVPTAPAAAPAARPAYIEYTVQKGDLLYTIAKAHGVAQADILAINTIENPDSLQIGQVIRIPKK